MAHTTAPTPSERVWRPRAIDRVLWGASLLGRRHTRVALVATAEDVAACWEARVPAVALGREVPTQAQVEAIRRLPCRTVVLMLPNDPNAAIGEAVAMLTMTPSAGVEVLVGEWRPYWNVTQVADLTPQRARKMFHSAR